MKYVAVQIDCGDRDCGKCRFVKHRDGEYKCSLWNIQLNEKVTGSIIRDQKCIENETRKIR